MTDPQPHPQRCETCENTACEFHKYRGQSQTLSKYPDEFMTSPSCITRIVGCASHSSRPATPAPKFNSTELILLAHDEWKRREERKHRHEESTWCQGFINGFLTDKKWAREWIDKIKKDAESLRRTTREEQ